MASIPPDDNHKFPSELEYMTPICRIHTSTERPQFLVTLHRGKDRRDRLAVWKPVGDYYQRVEFMEGLYPPGIGWFLPVSIFRYDVTRFLHITLRYSGTGYNTEETVFAISRDTLIPVKLFIGPEYSGVDLMPGESVQDGVFNNFSDDKLEFTYGIWNEMDAHCCPTAGKVTGTYRINRKTKRGSSGSYHEWTMTVEKAFGGPVRE